MKENIWHEVGEDWKMESVGGMKLGKRENLEKNIKIPDISHHNWTPVELFEIIYSTTATYCI